MRKITSTILTEMTAQNNPKEQGLHSSTLLQLSFIIQNIPEMHSKISY